MYKFYESALKERGLKNADVVRATGISHSTLTDWKKGRYEPKADKKKLIADYIGVSVEYLETGKKETYYINDETASIAQEIFENRDLRALFHVQKDMGPEDLKALYGMALALKRKERDQ